MNKLSNELSNFLTSSTKWIAAELEDHGVSVIAGLTGLCVLSPAVAMTFRPGD